MTKINNLTGQRFGRLVVLEISGRDNYKNLLWKCLCDCGNEVIVNRICLTSNYTNSCGCLRKELTANRVSGDKCPLARPDIVAKRTGELSPSKRLDVRKKMSENHWDCSGEKSPAWIDGRSYEPYCPKWTPELRNRIRAFFDYRCIICGKSQEENQQLLSCHHVEYDKSACCHGKPVHFAALCMSCHAKTNFDRDQWENIIHIIINEIYNDKSYYTKEEYVNMV